jgi:hypothetical protein
MEKESEKTQIECPYCDQQWPLRIEQAVIDAHMREKHPGKSWKPTSRNYMPPGVH